MPYTPGFRLRPVTTSSYSTALPRLCGSTPGIFNHRQVLTTQTFTRSLHFWRQPASGRAPVLCTLV